MTQDQKQRAKQIFLECWNNPDIQSKDLHTEIQIKLVEENIITPDSVLTEESVRASFGKIDEKYMNYRTRPRVREGLVFDFSEPQVTAPVQEEISRPDPVTFD